jgi:RNA recognition motif-containing protein
MSAKLFVGNISFTVTENDLQDFFAGIGAVISVNIIQDRATGRSRGFGFVEMANQEDAKKAISELNQKDFHGRQITVKEALPKEDRGDRGGFRGGRDSRDGGRGDRDYRSRRY